MRDADVAGKALHGSRKNSETPAVGRLFACLEQRLQAEADAQEGNAGAHALEDGIAQTELVQRAHHLAEMADARQHHFVRFLHRLRLIGDDVFRAEFIQRVLHGAQISGAVIDDGRHSRPLVEGS